MTVHESDQPVICERYGVKCIGSPCLTRRYERCPYFDDDRPSEKQAHIRMVKERQGLILYTYQ